MKTFVEFILELILWYYSLFIHMIMTKFFSDLTHLLHSGRAV